MPPAFTNVIGYADIARDELPAGSAAREFIGARRADELTQQMLAYSGKSTLIVKHVLLSALISDIARLLEVSISTKCVLRFELMDGAQPTTSQVPSELRQAIRSSASSPRSVST